MPRKKPAVALSPELADRIRPDAFPVVADPACMHPGPGITHFVRPADVAAMRRAYPMALVVGNSGVEPGMVWSIDVDAKLWTRPLSAVVPDLLLH